MEILNYSKVSNIVKKYIVFYGHKRDYLLIEVGI